MANKIELSENSYFLHFKSEKPNVKSLLIIPNSAGYFAQSPKYGKANHRIDKFCNDLAEKYEVYYLVLPGQDREISAEYTYSGSIETAVQAMQFLIKTHECVFAGVIGMCTGGAIAVEAMNQVGIDKIPLILYNTAVKVGWNNPAIQQIFLRKYGNVVNLDCEELERNAPAELNPIIEKHKGRILQIVSGNSDYSIDLQYLIKVPNMITKTFMSMSDAPIGESDEYPVLLRSIFRFL